MRHLLPILTLLLLFTSCKKNNETTETEGGRDALIGTWDLYRTWGGMSPLTIYPAGNGKELIFDSTTYKRVYNGRIVDEGEYELTNEAYTDVSSCEKIPAKDSKPNHIIYKNSLPLKSYFEVGPNTLRITISCTAVDGGGEEYRRKSTLTTNNK